MTDQPLILRDSGSLSVSFSPQAESLKAEALEKSAIINRVRTWEENQEATEAVCRLREVQKLVKGHAEDLRKPYRDFCSRVIATEKGFLADVDKEIQRLLGLQGDLQQAEKARLKSAEAARLECLDDLDRRCQEELSRAATLEDRDEIQERYNAEAAALPVIQPIRAEGQVITEDWNIEVLNERELARWHPNCVTIKPKLTEIRLMLDNGLTVRGIKAEQVTKAGVRLTKQTEALTV